MALVALVALCLAAVMAACGSEAITVAGDGPTPTAAEVATPTPEPTPDLGESPMPPERPDDFGARFSQDGRMAPWAEEVSVDGAAATYELWIEGVEWRFHHTPDPQRLDALYAEVRDGRFDLYEVIPFGDDEMIYDAESTSWRVEAGDFSHRLSASGEEIRGPSTGLRPLGAISGFSDLDVATIAVHTATIVVEDAVAQRWGTDLHFDFGSADFAMGDDRWTQELVVAFSQSPLEVPVVIRLNADSDEPVETTAVVTFVDGGTVTVGPDGEGGISVS